MRNSFLILSFLAFLLLTATQCKKDTVDQLSLLPPATTTGANTFGCLVNGIAMLPKSVMSQPSFDNPNAPYGMIPGLSMTAYGDGRKNIGFFTGWSGAPVLFMEFDIYDSILIRPNTNYWQQVDWGTGSTGVLDHVYYGGIYGEFINPRTNQYDWFETYNNSGSTTVTKFDTVNHIISGTFSGKLVQRYGTADTINITNGRFDINWKTVANKNFQ